VFDKFVPDEQSPSFARRGLNVLTAALFSSIIRRLAPRAALDAGAYFSFNPAMATSPRGRRLLQEMPRERVLTESDGPFVRYEDTIASPASVRFVCRQIAASWGVAESETAALVRHNFARLLKALPNAAEP